MATVPLPDVPCVRARLDYTQTDGFTSGNRIYFSYTGGAPTGAVCTSLADTITGEWAAHIASLVHEDWSLTEVDVLDIASDSGLSGQSTTPEAGTQGGTPLPAQVASNIEFNIARRYRGGKPRLFLPPPADTEVGTPSSFLDSFVTAVNAGFAAFIAACLGFSEGGTTLANHVNLSYYKGVDTTSPPWRGPGFKYPPKYRDTALSDIVSGYSMKSRMGSQKRRRASTTP
jgi:hypothetical protein